MTHRLSLYRALATLSLLGCIFSACQTAIPGPPNETIIYENHIRSRASVSANKPAQVGATGGAPDAGTPPAVVPCRPTRAADAEKMPARSSVTSPDAEAKPQPIFIEALWNKYQSVGQCFGCHTAQSLGGWNVTRNTFATKMDAAAIDRILSDDLALVMPKPPLGKRFSERSPDDPILQFANELKQWLAAGSPPDLFYPPTAVDSKKVFVLSETLGKSLTNIGDCIPDVAIVGKNKAAVAKLDAFFAQATELPKRLEETDMVSLDSEILAQQGVIAFAPAYPLWSDDAKKIRHVRVPAGKSIVYNPTTKNFDIPANTRFYKTFLKEVVDLKGNVSYRKIETRLIVSRPNVKQPDGTSQVTSLYGTYKWRHEDESEAWLQDAKLNDGTLFADELITYITDEAKAAPILTSDVPDVVKELEKQGLKRHYAIPGKTRCDQCHVGSPNASFVLGFTPLQIIRRPLGEGGTIEAPGEDELTQLQRLIDYGIITGMDASGRAAKLEDSQGARKPRNKYELAAQGYFLGNCSHCHNPRGFPSTSFPELASALNFWPDEAEGGIFQFPLTRMSPRTKRVGPMPDRSEKEFEIPYITPSLTEMELAFASESGGITKRKTRIALDGSKPPRSVPLTVTSGQSPNNKTEPVDAPWRSLIYRNVDTPFTYAEGKAIFTHMPLHTSGFDCRLPKIVGDWMVSIPARLRRTDDKGEVEQGWMTRCDVPLSVGGSLMSPFPRSTSLGIVDVHNCGVCAGDWCLDPEIIRFGFAVQPFAEVLPGAALALNVYSGQLGGFYTDAVAEAEERLKIYHAGERYNSCPDTSDIVDPEVQAGSKDEDGKTIVVPREKPPESPIQYRLGVPSHAHFIPTDTTQVHGPWSPKRSDWKKVLSLDPFATPLPSDFCCGPDCALGTICVGTDELEVLKLLKSIRITPEFRALALDEFPYGVWKENPSCDFSKKSTVQSFVQAVDPWQWVKESSVDQLKLPVYPQAPGGAVFEMICSNCHGRQADSHGKLAERVIELSGGKTRVANLRDGVLGPTDQPGTYRSDVFKSDADALGLSVDDLAGRYVAWMGLGGTKLDLPPSILQLVGATPIFGKQRTLTLPGGSPNMLQVAMELCRQVLPAEQTSFLTKRAGLSSAGVGRWGLFDTNGDAEMWQRLCGWENPPPVRAIDAVSAKAGGMIVSFVVQPHNLFDRAAYPGSTPVGTHDAQVASGVSPSNRMPWCLRPGEHTTPDALQAYAQANAVGGKPLPICPAEIFQDTTVMGGVSVSPRWTDERKTTWARRGAINAGLAVFVYVDAVARGTKGPKPAWDQCENLVK